MFPIPACLARTVRRSQSLSTATNPFLLFCFVVSIVDVSFVFKQTTVSTHVCLIPSLPTIMNDNNELSDDLAVVLCMVDAPAVGDDDEVPDTIFLFDVVTDHRYCFVGLVIGLIVDSVVYDTEEATNWYQPMARLEGCLSIHRDLERFGCVVAAVSCEGDSACVFVCKRDMRDVDDGHSSCLRSFVARDSCICRALLVTNGEW